MNNLGFLFGCDSKNNTIVDATFLEEYDYLKSRDVKVFIIDLENILSKDDVLIEKSLYPVSLIYRGWMLSYQQYEKLYQLLLTKNYQLMVSPTAYRESHYLDKWYPKLSDLTAKTYFSEGTPSEEKIKEMLSKFDHKSIIVKDYVKTLNYEWYESCFIKDASNNEEALKVINNFINKQGDSFSGGLVLREYLDIKKTNRHFKEGDGLENEEVRVFCLDKEPFCFISYWSGGVALRDRNFLGIIDKCNVLSSPFYTLDLAKLSTGEWIIIDVGDGQVSQLRGYDVEKFYDCFLSVLNISYQIY